MRTRLVCALCLLMLIIALCFNANAEPSFCQYDIHQSIMYNYLTYEERALYDQMYDALWSGKTTITTTCPISDTAVSWVMDYMQNEASELCAYDKDGTKVYGLSDGRKEIHLGYKMSVSAQRRYVDKVRKIVQRFAGMDEEQGLRAIHDYVVKTVEYGTNAQNTTWTSYCAINDGLAVCNGYAQAVSLLAHFAGYRCSYVSGSVYGDDGSYIGEHAWNVALVKDRFIWSDSTWDDGGQKSKSEWYGLTGSKMIKTHVPQSYYTAIQTLDTFLQSDVSCTMHLDVDKNGKYLRGATEDNQKNNQSVFLNVLDSGEYYAPAMVVWNNSSKDVYVNIACITDHVTKEWSNVRVSAGSNIAFRPDFTFLEGGIGEHTALWYYNGIPLTPFHWKTSLSKDEYFRMYLDVGKDGKFQRGSREEDNDKDNQVVSAADLNNSEYYTPALYVWTETASGKKVQISCEIDGKRFDWGETLIKKDAGIIYRPYMSELKNDFGKHKVVWYYNGHALPEFNWIVSQ